MHLSDAPVMYGTQEWSFGELLQVHSRKKTEGGAKIDDPEPHEAVVQFAFFGTNGPMCDNF